MKKVLTILLVLALLFSLCGCGGKKDPLVGTWTLSALEKNGTDYSFLVDTMDLVLIFREDGSGSLCSAAGDLPLTWDDSGFSDGDLRFACSFDAEGRLCFEAEGLHYRFSRAS